MITLAERLRDRLRGDVLTDAKTLKTYSRDTSVFTRTPEVVVFPKDTADVSGLVKAVIEAKQDGASASITARSAGTDMSGGPLTDSVSAVFTKYMNKVIEVADGYAVAEPGAYYRDFERETRKLHAQVLPSYPASRELCALGGIVNNNSGGERTLEYGKTDKYVDELEVVLSDGSVTSFKALTTSELETKKKLDTLEGAIYREMDDLLTKNASIIKAAKPTVSKNSAGYSLWNVKDETKGTFDLTKMKLRLVREQGYRSMLVIFLSDPALLPEIVSRVLPFNPESFESYDDTTFKLAVRFLPEMLKQMGFWAAVRLGLSFLPETFMALTGGIPKLVLMAEFSEDTHEMALGAARGAEAAVKPMRVQTSIKKNERAAEKYWRVRRESFALLRKNSHGLYAAPFIDDFVIPPEKYPEFWPRLTELLNQYKDRFIYTVAGHIGNGNFHIIPLMDLSRPEVRDVILELSPKVYELVLEFGGSTTGEHNDGIIRTPYLPMQFGDEVVALFKETKLIFDPENIFNPGKKVDGTFADIERSLIKGV
jgi:FAD/FMN-containing dehydrogenase